MGRKRNSPSTACAACLVSAKAAILPGEVGWPAAANATTWCCWRMSGRPSPYRTALMAGSWQPVLLDRLSGQAPQARHPDLNVRHRELLRQRDGGDVLQDPEIRARLAEHLLHPSRS